MNRRVTARPDFSRWTALLLFGLAACIGIVVSACDQEPKGVVAVNADSAEAVIETVEPTSEIEVTNRGVRPTGVGDNSDERNLDNQPSLRPIDGDTDSSVFSESISINAFMVAPLELRVAVADVIVRAVFVSEGTDALRFRAIEYLKGTGPTEFEVKASTEGRNRKWDDREGVLILADGRNEVAAIETGERVDDALYFVRFWTFSSYAGSLPDTYTIEGYRPAWLPATEAGVIRAASDNTVTYLTDDWNLPIISYGTLSVPALRLIIAEWERMLEANRRSSVTELEDGPISVDDIGQLGSEPSFASVWVQPVEMLVRDSDIVVRAVFVSESSDLLRFRSIEYLKGTGPAEFEVRASTEGRNRKWDDREGVLLLSYGRNTEARRGEDERMDEALYFTNSRPAATGYYGSLPDTYMYYGRKPAWLPAIGEGIIRAEGNTTVSYTTGTWPYGGVPPAGQDYTRSVTELREMIAYQDWLQGLDPNYRFPATEDTCQYWQEYYARRPTTFVTELSSGTAEGDGVLAFERLEALETTDQYHILALNESDAILFDAKIIDSDSSAENGFAYKLANARPLARGTYKFMESLIDSWYASCSDDPLSRKRRYKVTVNAPTGTLHEAFFDPVGLSGEAIGATGSSGVIDPDEFTVGNDDVEIGGLEWRGGSVVLELDDYVSLSGQTLDFIKLDGSIDTSLDIADATVNQTATTWTWSLASQPWEDGDQLLLRIRETSA